MQRVHSGERRSASAGRPFRASRGGSRARLLALKGERRGCVHHGREPIANVCRAGLLHDLVGLGRALGKEGPLTDGEWERVRLHPYLHRARTRAAGGSGADGDPRRRSIASDSTDRATTGGCRRSRMSSSLREVGVLVDRYDLGPGWQAGHLANEHAGGTNEHAGGTWVPRGAMPAPPCASRRAPRRPWRRAARGRVISSIPTAGMTLAPGDGGTAQDGRAVSRGSRPGGR
jgi:hypothetical protein